VLEALLQLDWVARIDPAPNQTDPRYVLLADPANTPLAPLVHALLLRQQPATAGVWDSAGWYRRMLGEVL
jgi:membrane protein